VAVAQGTPAAAPSAPPVVQAPPAPPPAPAPELYEYRLEEVIWSFAVLNREAMDAKLKDLGAKGWRLSGTVQAGGGTQAMIFMRPKR
jgi:hypothetical protein